MVSLTPDLASAAFVSLRNSSSSVTSASSYCVTCGIITQLRCRFGPLIFWMRDSGCNAVGPNFEKSSEGHGSRYIPAPPCATEGAAAAPVITDLTCACTSCCVMRPLWPLPRTRDRSTPSSRANLRIEGDACGKPPLCAEGACATSTAAATGAAVCCGADAGAEAPAGAADAAAEEAAEEDGCAASCLASDASASSSRLPSATLSPSLTRISLTTPATLDGISMLALSDSTVTKDWSTSIRSPALTSNSMTSTSLKSPMSGTITSTMLIALAPFFLSLQYAAGPISGVSAPTIGPAAFLARKGIC